MRKFIHKFLKFRRTVSFVFESPVYAEEWTLFGTFKFIIR